MTVTKTCAESTIQISAPDWSQVQAVLAREVPQLEVWAFGSRARHTAKPYSDLDLALIGPAPLTLEQLASIRHAFESSDLTIRVDVVEWVALSEAFRTIISADKVVLQVAKR